MKKIALVLLLMIGFTLILGAVESDYYVKTLYIEKIYPHVLGFKIEYRRSNSIYLAEAYLPLEWFGRPDSPARIVYANDNSVPFVNIYWKNGEFHHLVLFVHESPQHISWGSLAQTEGVANRFDIDEPEFVF
ncbi:MAG: hypothetical protein V3S41_07325 [Spirochaetia bacterium]